MEASLQVTLVTPGGELHRGPQPCVVAPSVDGEVTILPQHDLLLAQLAAGVVQLGDGATAVRLFVPGGFLEVQDDQVTLLVDAAEPTATINSASAIGQLQKAEAALRQLDVGAPGYAQAWAAVQVARRRLDAAQ